jgi:hypothetical protein
MKTWDYKVDELDYKYIINRDKQEKYLQERGKQGWELINCVESRYTQTSIFYFKKEIKN